MTEKPTSCSHMRPKIWRRKGPMGESQRRYFREIGSQREKSKESQFYWQQRRFTIARYTYYSIPCGSVCLLGMLDWIFNPMRLSSYEHPQIASATASIQQIESYCKDSSTRLTQHSDKLSRYNISSQVEQQDPKLLVQSIGSASRNS